VFVLWGKHAQDKAKHVSTSKHHVISCPHPSGLSAHRGFFGSKCFSKVNAALREMKKDEIDWQV
jgi:uracil-DNA glycosylase